MLLKFQEKLRPALIMEPVLGFLPQTVFGCFLASAGMQSKDQKFDWIKDLGSATLPSSAGDKQPLGCNKNFTCFEPRQNMTYSKSCSHKWNAGCI